ncbi:MAG: protein kinase [Myxococcota bacterium]|nr:protein kinase [Myxococcota bacterium]
MGRYRLNRMIGEGGMGGVYEAEHIEIGRLVAVKLVHGLHARDRLITGRIKQEARSTSAIDSENIVQVFDAGEDDELGVFLVMELLKGEDLSALVARRKGLRQREAATIAMQAAQGLARAHAVGIIHRDLKPANIFLCVRDDGSPLVKLVDFGIAKIVRDAQGQQGRLTYVGMVIGTPQYMSPEQAQGLPTVDHRTDIYSLGSVLFEMIAGRSPYPEMPTYEQTILQIMTRPPERLSQFVPSVHQGLDQLCADMMAHDPLRRPQDMKTVRKRLARILPELGDVPLPVIGGDSMPAPPLTHTAVAVDSTASESLRAIAGLPQKRSGAVYVGIAAIAAVGLVAGSLAVARIVRPISAISNAKSGYGLVQQTPATAPTVVLPDYRAAVSMANPPAVVLAPVALMAAPLPPPQPRIAFDAPVTRPTGSPVDTKRRGNSVPKPPVAAPPLLPASAAAKPPSPSRPVGGMGVSGWDDDSPPQNTH